MTNWSLPIPIGPTLDIKKKPTGVTPFPYFEDERTEDEVQQDRFNDWQQRWEVEMQNDKN